MRICMSVSEHIIVTTNANFTKFSVHVMLCTSGFADDVTCGHNGDVSRRIFARAQYGFDTEANTENDPPWAAPVRRRSLISTIALFYVRFAPHRPHAVRRRGPFIYTVRQKKGTSFLLSASF